MNIILATGGTGGHIFPAIALAKALEAQGYKCTLFIDKQIYKSTGIQSYVLPLCKPSSHKLKFFFLLFYSCILAVYNTRRLKPKLVIGFGSYASFSTLLAAKILFIPIILHEQNSVLGRVNRFFLKSAKLVATSFPTTKYAQKDKCVVTGNFVGKEVLEMQDMPENLNILIIAGSQGANFFDDVVSSAICDLPETIKKRIRIVQQCTKKNISKVESLYKSEKINFELSEFFDDIEKKLTTSHLVISRAGATSIAEITLSRRAAIYIPYPYSKDNHQFYNAKHIADVNAAVIIEQNGETKQNLTGLLLNLLSDSKKLYNMASNTRKTEIKNGIINFIQMLTSKQNTKKY